MTISDSITALATRVGEEFVTVREEMTDYLPLSGGAITGGLFGTSVTGTSITDTIDLDVSTGDIFNVILTADTTFTISGTPEGRTACFSLILTDGGSYTVTWPDSVAWAGLQAPDLTASGTDVLTFITPDGGTTWYGCLCIEGAG